MNFWKMHGLGNDYIIIDNRSCVIEDKRVPSLARRICQRRFSVGADGLLLVYKSDVADAKMRIFNPDGSEAEMCGNGIRCFAKYCYENNICRKEEMEIETLAGVKKVKVDVEGGKVKNVTVNMGSPVFDRERIPVLGKGKCVGEKLDVDGETFEITCLSIGNPHCVIFVDQVEDFPVGYYGPKIEKHSLFPRRVNVEFVQVMARDRLRVRVWERGVGETFACGTGACASVAAGKILGVVDERCTVNLKGGELYIEFRDGEIFMTGPAVKVYSGSLMLEDAL